MKYFTQQVNLVMSRRRYISTDISIDKKVNRLACEYGDFAALLYTWMIPHAGDDATINGDPEELMFAVIPGRRDRTVDDVVSALHGMHELGLTEWDRSARVVKFPATAFYRYQTYIPEAKRDAANISENQRESAQNTAPPPPPPSPPPSFTPSPPPNIEEQTILDILAQTPNYKFDSANDLLYLRTLALDFPRLDLLDEIKNWRAHKDSKPLKSTGNHHLGLRNWLKNAVKYGHERNITKPLIESGYRGY